MENIILTNNKDLRLVGVKVGVLSTLRFELPLVSASATHVEVIVTSGGVHSAYTATFVPSTKRWQCDIAASQFPEVGKQSYEVAYVLDGKQFWDGKGWIEIEDATTSGIEPQPRPEPYRYVVLSVNGYGADAQGAVRIPRTFISTNSPVTTEGYMEGDIYFNRLTGAMWTLCDVQDTLTWVFNYSNYYTKAETDEQIDRLAAYYITSDAQGNPFATHAALVNAQTYYSGGSVRTPTRNDYAVVSADETHGGAEWRYIYAVDAQGAGQWEPQYAVGGVIAYDDTVTRTSANGVKSSGIWSAIWGALAALPTGFSSLYDWVVDRLAGKADDDAVVKLTGDQTVAGAKTFTGAATFNNGATVYGMALVEGGLSVSFGPSYDDGGWNITKDANGNFVLNIIAGDNSGTLTLPFSSGTLALVSQIPDVTARLQQIAAFPAFDATASYAVGDKVTHQGQIYECTTAHSGAWEAGDFTVRTLGYLLGLKQTKITASGMLKGDGAGGVTQAVTGTDYAGMGNLPYDIGTPIVISTASSETVEGETVYYGAATLANRTANIVQVTAATALDELRITFPAATSGKVRDFGLRVEIGTGSAALAAPALVPIAPTGETIKIENADGTIPALADGTATAKGVTLLYFSETAPGVFVVKGEQVEEVA